jgi:putative NIF3 family GTP cyclohydrolase 1 type 2
VLDHFLTRAPWVDRATTVDRIIVGDPNADVARCLVAWMPSVDAIQSAADSGVELLVCHEPTFWNHRDDKLRDSPAGGRKLRLIEERRLVVMRNHDCWDRWPEIGIPWAWARHLGFVGRPAVIGANGYQHRYDRDAVPFEEFARQVAGRTAALGAPPVEASGNPGKMVSRIGVGTGCGCSVFEFLEMGCDCCIICDDGASYWGDVQYAADQGVPVICVNHGTSEEPGMATLADYINRELDGLEAEHLLQRCPFRLVGA